MTSEKRKPYLVDGDDWELSASKIYGKKIVDLRGSIGSPYGGEPSFGIHTVVFEDGSTEWVEGEHDWAYLYGHPLFDELYEDDEDE